MTSRQATAYNPTVPNIARMYDALLGGKDNGQVDREAVQEAIKRIPDLPLWAKENRKFLHRTVRYLTAQGVRQFVDIGAGLPTLTNTHDIAQDLAPEARVVYVDNDPLVLAHGRALLATNDNTTVITADLRDPDTIIGHPELKELIDWSRPVAVLLVAILHFIPDRDNPYGAVTKLRAAMAPGSYLVLSHGERNPQTVDAAKVYDQANAPGIPRTRRAIERFFHGLQLVDPGLVPVSKWRRGTNAGEDIPFLGGVALKQTEESHG